MSVAGAARMAGEEPPEAARTALREGMRVAFRFSIGADDMERFAASSGDRNPVHWDRDYARGCGFSDPVVYGGLLVAKVSRLVGMELPIGDCLWTGLKIDFRRPLYVGEEAELSGEVVHVAEAVHSATLKLTIKSVRWLVASGTAEVSYRDG